MKILSFESSCDETSVSVTENGRKILSNEILSQIDIHKRYGGVVPEIASRAHIEAISPLCRAALNSAGVSLDEIDAVAVTCCPGLIGALLVGVNFAKSLAFSAEKPLIGVNHIKGHIAANYLAHEQLKPPFLALVMSGGHTSIVGVNSYTSHKTIGVTRDDAVGEAFDKVARIIGIPYPGGKEMDRLASLGSTGNFVFPHAAVKDSHYDFSFSGLKTAVINRIHNSEQKEEAFSREDLARGFTDSVIYSLKDRIEKVFSDYDYPALVLAGGVAANSHIRAALTELSEKLGKKIYLPPLSLCGDNGAMIGSQAYYEYLEGNLAGSNLNARARAN